MIVYITCGIATKISTQEQKAMCLTYLVSCVFVDEWIFYLYNKLQLLLGKFKNVIDFKRDTVLIWSHQNTVYLHVLHLCDHVNRSFSVS